MRPLGLRLSTNATQVSINRNSNPTPIRMTQKRLDAFFKSTKPAKTLAASNTPEVDTASNKKQKTVETVVATTDDTPTTSLATMRSNANRNLALAKQAVIACEKTGSLPTLSSLLIEPTWKDALSSEMSKPYFLALERFVQSAWNSSMVFPPKDCVFRAYNAVPLDRVKVVILGQVRAVF